MATLDSRHVKFLDAVNCLEKAGLSNDISIPRLVVCGDQSSGKSSTLEALSSVPFPTAGTLCTKSPLELLLRNKPEYKVAASIIPSESCTDQEREALDKFRVVVHEDADFADIINKANTVMGIGKDKTFSDHILRIEYHSPNVPNMTLIDLPGLFAAADENQTLQDKAFVENMVGRYMKGSRTFILAVVHGKVEIANQMVMTQAEIADPKGERTLGIVTKLDRLAPGEDEALSGKFQKLLQNAPDSARHLKHGWYAVVNRGQSQQDTSQEERNTTERLFFETTEPWLTLDKGVIGIQAVKEKIKEISLQSMLGDAVALLWDITEERRRIRSELTQLGQSGDDVQAARDTLRDVAEEFSRLIQEVLFNRVEPEPNNALDLVGKIDSCIERFRGRMKRKGQGLADLTDQGREGLLSRDQLLMGLEQKIRDRHTMAQGNLDMKSVSNLFYEQALPWKELVNKLTQSVLRDVRHGVETFLRLAIQERMDDEDLDTLVSKILATILRPALNGLRDDLRERAENAIRAHAKQEILIYNNEMADHLQNARTSFTKANVGSKIEELGRDQRHKISSLGFTKVMSNITDDLLSHFDDPAMQTPRTTALEEVAYMEAHYAVEFDKLIDRFSSYEVMEMVRHRLLKAFKSTSIKELSDDEVREIMDISTAPSETQKNLQAKLDLIDQALESLGEVVAGAKNGKRKSGEDLNDAPAKSPKIAT